jgi:hypothetical protein
MLLINGVHMKQRTPIKFILFILTISLWVLSSCNSSQAKLNLGDKVLDVKTEYKTGFFNIDEVYETLEVVSIVNVTSGTLKYTLSDPGGNAIYAGTLESGDILDETTGLVPLKGNYFLNLDLVEFSGDYQFTITPRD